MIPLFISVTQIARRMQRISATNDDLELCSTSNSTKLQQEIGHEDGSLEVGIEAEPTAAAADRLSEWVEMQRTV